MPKKEITKLGPILTFSFRFDLKKKKTKMFPLTARRLETTWLPYSRQSLPRPARLYSTPSRRNNAPASALATQPHAGYPEFMPTVEKRRPELFPQTSDMKSFLGRRIPYTILPTPLPDDRSSPLNEMYFIRSPTQDLLSVMGACLHNLYDVPRAKQIFERLRKSDIGVTLLDARQYNAFLNAYVEMAATKDVENRARWLEDAWSLFDVMERGTEKVLPTAGTYAVMLLSWLRYVLPSHPQCLCAIVNSPLKDSTRNLIQILRYPLGAIRQYSSQTSTTGKSPSQMSSLIASSHPRTTLLKSSEFSLELP